MSFLSFAQNGQRRCGPFFFFFRTFLPCILHSSLKLAIVCTNHSCVFHLIYRGKFRSKPWEAILEEARYLVSQGAIELNLIAEDTNQWGQDRRDGRNLAHLLKALGQIEGLQWIRLLYCYPSYFHDELIDEIATNEKVRRRRNVVVCLFT